MSGEEHELGIIRPRLSMSDLEEFSRSLSDDIKSDGLREKFETWIYIIKYFLGNAWVNEHIRLPPHLPLSHGQRFFGMDFTSDEARELKTMRVFDLAEILMNLQMVEGFDFTVQRLKQGKGQQIESTYAELQIAKVLYQYDLRFRFIRPTGTKKEDYDFEVTYPCGTMAFVEAKCTIESGPIHVQTIENALNTARRQIPKNGPGIIFVKVPQHWYEGHQVGAPLRKIPAITNLTERFLRGTNRVASVKYYVSYVTIMNGQVLHRHAFQEFDTPKQQFKRRGWDIFTGPHVPESESGAPHFWIRLAPTR